MPPKLKILFLCTGNSCRSQMAEGWARHLRGEVIEPFSAGIETHGLNPNAVRVMAEAGVDISGQRSRHVEEFRNIKFDYVITMCDHAQENCPLLVHDAPVYHVGFSDPPRLAMEIAQKGAGLEEQLDCYRTVRDQIRDFVEGIPGNLAAISAFRRSSS